MAKANDAVVADFLERTYKPNLQDLIYQFSDLPEGENGFYTNAAKNINSQLAKLGIEEIPEQYANDLFSGRKITRDGVGLFLAYRLGAALSGCKDPAKAIALFYLWACGIWATDESASSVLERLSKNSATASTKEAMADLSGKMDKILAALNVSAAPNLHPLVLRLKKDLPEDAVLSQKIQEYFEGYEDAAEKMLGVFITGTTPPWRGLWLQISNVLNFFSAKNKWSPKLIEIETRKLKMSQAQRDELSPPPDVSHPSKSAPDSVLPK